jgi:hypothetical protein
VKDLIGSGKGEIVAMAVASGILGLACAVIAGRPAIRRDRNRLRLHVGLGRQNAGRRFDGWLYLGGPGSDSPGVDL